MLQIDISIKFRAFGVTLGNYGPDSFKVPLPPAYELVGGILPDHKPFFTYDKHGVKVVLSLA